MSLDIDLPDFDMLVEMHRDNPEAFEEYRRRLLRQAVDDAPQVHRPSLEQLLDRIEENRAAATTPEQAALSAFCMMRDSVSRLSHSWKQAHYELAGLQASLAILRAQQ